MTRRNLFKSLCCAVAMSAMEVCGMREMTRAELDDLTFLANLRNMKRNLEQNIMDIWEERDATLPALD